MLSKIISIILVAVLLQGSLIAQTTFSAPQNIAQMQQILRKAQEKNKAVKITLNREIDNQTTFTGKVSEISETGFALSDQKSGKVTTLAYADVVEMKQKGLSKGAKIAIGIGVAVGVLMVVGVAACYGSGVCKG